MRLDPPVGNVEALTSKSTGDIYEILVLPEKVGIHQGLGCEGEVFNGPMACWHSKRYTTEGLFLMANEETKALAVRTVGALAETARLRFSPDQLRVIKNLICAGANDDEFNLFVSVAERLDLDPFNREIHAVFRSTKVSKRGEPDRYEDRMAIQIGIDGIRKVAASTGLYAGQEGPFFSEDGEKWSLVPASSKPKYCRIKIHRKDFALPIDSICRWDAYAQKMSNGNLIGLWSTRGPEQLAKCTEAIGLRRAFPRLMADVASAVGTELDEAPIDASYRIAVPADPDKAIAAPEAAVAEAEEAESPFSEGEYTESPVRSEDELHKLYVEHIATWLVDLAQATPDYKTIARNLVERFPQILVDKRLKPSSLDFATARLVRRALRIVMQNYNLIGPDPHPVGPDADPDDEAPKEAEQSEQEYEVEAPAPGCEHPQDSIAAHPTDAAKFICKDCGEEVEVAID